MAKESPIIGPVAAALRAVGINERWALPIVIVNLILATTAVVVILLVLL